VSAPEQANPNNHRIALGIEYDGSPYSGWQKQKFPQQETVQEYIETALSKVADSNVVVSCAGRTDAGVHATCQVVHFDTEIDRGAKAWTQGVNSMLPRTIRVVWSRTQEDDFHARFSALSRRYLYLMYQRETQSAMLHGRASYSRRELDEVSMHAAAQHFLGEQDFTSFRAAGCQSKTAMRNVMHANVYRRGGFLIFDVKANAFLQHMVRNMMGSLLQVGRGDKGPAWIAELLSLQDRARAAPTALPDGLYLVGVEYPQSCDLPSEISQPDLLLAI
jgi:tRNA pseudouridine38-40 synthase|tara:strand:- start:24 stop:851 length:828 start_codon:yes stop_codon:yes gene_type:complete